MEQIKQGGCCNTQTITDYRLSQKRCISAREMYFKMCVEWLVISVLVGRKLIFDEDMSEKQLLRFISQLP